MMYKIFEIYRNTKARHNTYLIRLNNDQEMVDYCFAMDNDLYFYYGKRTY